MIVRDDEGLKPSDVDDDGKAMVKQGSLDNFDNSNENDDDDDNEDMCGDEDDDDDDDEYDSYNNVPSFVSANHMKTENRIDVSYLRHNGR